MTDVSGVCYWSWLIGCFHVFCASTVCVIIVNGFGVRSGILNSCLLSIPPARAFGSAASLLSLLLMMKDEYGGTVQLVLSLHSNGSGFEQGLATKNLPVPAWVFLQALQLPHTVQRHIGVNWVSPVIKWQPVLIKISGIDNGSWMDWSIKRIHSVIISSEDFTSRQSTLVSTLCQPQKQVFRMCDMGKSPCPTVQPWTWHNLSPSCEFTVFFPSILY